MSSFSPVFSVFPSQNPSSFKIFRPGNPKYNIGFHIMVVEVLILLNLIHRDVDCLIGENRVLPISHKIQ